jgi:hypothetical protein
MQKTPFFGFAGIVAYPPSPAVTGGDVHPWRKSPTLYRICTGGNYGNTGVVDERAESRKNEGDSRRDITPLCVRMSDSALVSRQKLHVMTIEVTGLPCLMTEMS